MPEQTDHALFLVTHLTLMIPHMSPGACSNSAVSYLTGIESQRQHAVKAGLDKLQSVGRSRQEKRRGKTVPLITHTHVHNVAGCCIYLLWNLQQEKIEFMSQETKVKQ